MKRLPVSLLLVLQLFSAGAEAAQVSDMYGRAVALPGHLAKVMGASPPVTYLLYTIDPGLLAGLNSTPSAKQQRVLRPETGKLPVVGGFGGPGGNFNAEVLMTIHPDLVVVWPPRSGALNPKVAGILSSAGIPYALIKLDRLSDYPAAYEFLGELLGRRERGKQLAAYFRGELKKLQSFAAAIPAQKRVAVYFAQERDGLTTVSSSSVHAEAIALAGGRNVYRNDSESRRAKDHLSLEQVISFDPEVIIVQDESFFKAVYQDARWGGIRAVRDRKVYLVPDIPFDWMDTPPSFLRLLGAQWLAGVLYPQSAGSNLASETRKFFQTFFGVNPGDREIRALLNQ